MMLPSGLLEVLEVLEVPARFAIELSTKEEMIDCADAALVEDVVPDVAPEALEVPAVRALIRFWNAVLKLEVTLLEAPEPPADAAEQFAVRRGNCEAGQCRGRRRRGGGRGACRRTRGGAQRAAADASN